MNEILTFRRALPSTVLSSNDIQSAAEAARLQMLESYGILDSVAEKSYDDIARLAAFVCAAPVSLISFFDCDRQWIKARFSSGAFLDNDHELPRSFAFCEVAIQEPERVILVPDMTKDARFADHALVTGKTKLRLYAAVPLIAPT
ncbi:MAG TPA: hypothetical protein VMV54_04555, partial [Acidocella sp.]|nr:hypothetical protein [Acidocella sp.]